MLKHKDYDWFDLDDSGNIVLQPKIPIFPEDFPPGKKEWPLSWWGIVDPALGEIESRFLEAMAQVDGFEIERRQLRLKSGDRVVLTFAVTATPAG